VGNQYGSNRKYYSLVPSAPRRTVLCAERGIWWHSRQQSGLVSPRLKGVMIETVQRPQDSYARTPVTSQKGGITMPRLSDPRLAIKVASGSPNAIVTASVDVSFSAQERALIDLFEQAGTPLRYRVTCRIRGANNPIQEPDQALFTLGNVTVHTDRNDIPFERVVSSDSWMRIRVWFLVSTKFMHGSGARPLVTQSHSPRQKR
jgi:hypothetical protein